MSLFPFKKEDIVRSVIKANPEISFKIYNGNIYTTLKDSEDMVFSPISNACDIVGLDFSCPDNSGYIGVI
jgi:hypothetical protein